MNRRKNTKSIWSKFSSPTNHSVANLMMIDPPASSTTKLLRGKGTGGGCDNHSFYAATGKFFILVFVCIRLIKILQKKQSSCNYTGCGTNSISTWFNIGAFNATNLRCKQCGGGPNITKDGHKCGGLIICSDGTNANAKSIVFRIANHDWGQRSAMVSWPT